MVDDRRTFHGDGKGEATDRRVVAYRLQAVHGVGRNLHQVALPYLLRLALDHHDPAAGEHVIELEGRMAVRVNLAAADHFELADQLEVTPKRLIAHLTRLIEPPDRHGALMLRRS